MPVSSDRDGQNLWTNTSIISLSDKCSTENFYVAPRTPWVNLCSNFYQVSFSMSNDNSSAAAQRQKIIIALRDVVRKLMPSLHGSAPLPDDATKALSENLESAFFLGLRVKQLNCIPFWAFVEKIMCCDACDGNISASLPICAIFIAIFLEACPELKRIAEHVAMLKLVHSPGAKMRSFIRCALNDHCIDNCFLFMMSQQKAVHTYYTADAFLHHSNSDGTALVMHTFLLSWGTCTNSRFVIGCNFRWPYYDHSRYSHLNMRLIVLNSMCFRDGCPKVWKRRACPQSSCLLLFNRLHHNHLRVYQPVVVHWSHLLDH